jgi:tripartite-type tricarboxylate transporter receptor subunit TctC
MKYPFIGRRAALSALLVSLCCGMAGAADLASKPLRIIVPFAAGGTADVLARVLADKLRARFPQGAIVENRTGAGGNIGAELVFKSEPDGQTLLLSSPGPISVNQSLYPKLGFEPDKWVTVAVVAEVPNALVTGSKLPVKSAQEFVAFAKANPGKVSYASQGNGTTSHLTAKLFESVTGAEMVHIPYRGDTPALADLAGGQVDVFFTNLSAAMALHKAGKVHILAVADSKRAGSLPDVPTVAGIGLPQMQAVTWYAVVAPPGTPADLVKALNEALVAAIDQPDLRQRYSDLGLSAVRSAPDQAARFVRGETARWQKLIRDAKVTIE